MHDCAPVAQVVHFNSDKAIAAPAYCSCYLQQPNSRADMKGERKRERCFLHRGLHLHMVHILLRTAGRLDIKARDTLTQKAYDKQKRSNEARDSRGSYSSVSDQTVSSFLSHVCKREDPELVKAIEWIFNVNDISFRTQLAELQWNDFPSHDLWDHRVRALSLCKNTNVAL